MVKVLFVEDDVNLREIYAARLSAEDYSVIVASDGEEALAKAIQEKPDLIVLDVMMPKISGFDVLDIIRSTSEIKDMKVIVLTALSQESDRERADRLGVSKYLVKSQITLEDVVEAIKTSLGQPIATSTADEPNNTQSMSPAQTNHQANSMGDVSTTTSDDQTTSSSPQDDTPPEEIENNVEKMLKKNDISFQASDLKNEEEKNTLKPSIDLNPTNDKKDKPA